MNVLFDATVRRSLFFPAWLVPLICAFPLLAQAMQCKVPAPVLAPAPARPGPPIPAPLTKPTDRAPLPAVGSIGGTVSWFVGKPAGQRTILKGSDWIQSMLALQPWVETAQGTYSGPPSSYPRKKVGTGPKYSPVISEGTSAGVTYTSSGLPEGVELWVGSEIPANTFNSTYPSGVFLTLSSGLEIKDSKLELGPVITFPMTTAPNPR